jgi:hypothetical protein
LFPSSITLDIVFQKRKKPIGAKVWKPGDGITRGVPYARPVHSLIQSVKERLALFRPLKRLRNSLGCKRSTASEQKKEGYQENGTTFFHLLHGPFFFSIMKYLAMSTKELAESFG